MKGKILLGIAIGYGLAKVGSAVFPALAEAARPMTRKALKSGFKLYEKGMEKAAEAGEFIEDIAVEVAVELEQERADKETEFEPETEPADDTDLADSASENFTPEDIAAKKTAVKDEQV